MDSESVNHGEGKVLGHGAGRGQRLPEGCLVSASCGVPDSVYLRFQAGQIHDPSPLESGLEGGWGSGCPVWSCKDGFPEEGRERG